MEALLTAGPHMVAFFHRRTSVRMVSGTWIADIKGHLPGAGTGGRSVGPKPFNARRLRKELRTKLRPQLYETSLLGMGIMAGPDLQAFLHATRSPKAFAHAGWRVGFHTVDLATHRQGMQLVNGPALVARLMKSADDLGVRLWTRARGRKLLTDDDGGVRGALLSTPDGDREVRARRGVVLAAGGFPHDVARRRELFPRTPTGREHWPLAPASATGDGIRLGEAVGGQLDRTLASPVAWCPVSLVPYRNGRVGVYPHIVDRGKPGLIAVLADGRRFVNEADGYHDFVSAMVEAVPADSEVAAWLICDHAFQRRYPFGMSKPFPVPITPYLRSGYLTRGRTLVELAGRCGIDADRAGEDGRRVQRARPPRRGPGVRPRHDAVQPRIGRPRPRPQPVAGAAGPAALLRHQGPAGQLRHVRRAARPTRTRGCWTGPAIPFAACTRSAATRPTCSAATTRPAASTSARR